MWFTVDSPYKIKPVKETRCLFLALCNWKQPVPPEHKVCRHSHTMPKSCNSTALTSCTWTPCIWHAIHQCLSMHNATSATKQNMNQLSNTSPCSRCSDCKCYLSEVKATRNETKKVGLLPKRYQKWLIETCPCIHFQRKSIHLQQIVPHTPRKSMGCQV